MLTVIEKVDLLQKFRYFQGVRSESLAQLAMLSRQSTYETGDVLYAENTPAQSMFAIIDGEASLSREGAGCGKAAAHELAGVLDVIAGQPYRETAVAAERISALVIDEQDFFDTIADDFNFTRGVMRALAHAAAGSV